MNNKLYIYIKGIFQRNFPESYLILNDKQFAHIQQDYAKLVRGTLVKKYDHKDILAGVEDIQIKADLEEFLNKYFTDKQRNEYNQLYNSVNKILQANSNKFSFVCSDDIFDHITKLIVYRLYPQYSSDIDYEKLNNDVNLLYEQITSQEKKFLYSKVTETINNNAEITDFTINGISHEELKKWVISSIFSNENREFLQQLNIVVVKPYIINSIEKKISQYVKKYIKDNTVVLPDARAYLYGYIANTLEMSIDLKSMDYGATFTSLIERVYEKLKQQGFRDKEIVLSECDGVIKNLYEETKRELAIQYIGSYIKANVEHSVSDSFLEKVKYNIYNRLTIDDKLSDIEILATECQLTISTYYNIEKMKYRSIKNRERNARIKRENKKRKIQKTVATLLVLSTLVGVGYGVYSTVDFIHDKFAIIKAKNFDDNYSPIYRNDAPRFDDTVNNIIEMYDKYDKYGNDNFKCIPFYRAYRSVKQHRLVIMDQMLDQIQYKVANNPSHRNLYMEVLNHSCYLDLMYDHLEKMGCSKITGAKYDKLLDAYMDAKVIHPFDDPFDYLSKEQKELLYEVRDLYIEYCEECMVEFGDALDKGPQVQDDSLAKSGRRSSL